MRTPLVAVALALAAGASCNRAAPEQFVAPSGSPPVAKLSPPVDEAAARQSTAPEPARCIRPTPDVAPPSASPGPDPRCPADPEEKTARKLPVVRVAFEGSRATVDAELARDQHDTMRGLMFRKAMSEDRGMLFDLGVREDHEFWMHNTCIPLDLLYVDEDGFIVGIVENAPTLNDDSRGVGCPSRYVLEVNAGWARRHGVKAGQRLVVPAEAR